MRTTPRTRLLAAAALLASLGLTATVGLAPAGSAQEGGEGGDAGSTTTTQPPPPDDLGVVHSWALAPGDGTLEAGERPNLAYELPPGGEAEDVVTLFNYSNVPLTFDVYTTDAFNGPDGAFSLLPFDEEPTDVGTWFDIAEDASITIPPGTQATFPITIRVPVDARPGDHAGAILAASDAVGTSPDGDIVTLDRRTGTRVYVRVTGPLEPALAIEDVTTTYSPELNPGSGGATVSYTVVNRGNVRLGAVHGATVSGPFGLFGRDTERQEIVELLPGERVEVTHTLDDVPATGLLFTDVDLEPRSVDGGALPLGDAGRSSFAFAIPFAIVALVLAGVLGWYSRRAYLRRRDLEEPVRKQPLGARPA
jgi:hypothetical protein